MWKEDSWGLYTPYNLSSSCGEITRHLTLWLSVDVVTMIPSCRNDNNRYQQPKGQIFQAWDRFFQKRGMPPLTNTCQRWWIIIVQGWNRITLADLGLLLNYHSLSSCCNLSRVIKIMYDGYTFNVKIKKLRSRNQQCNQHAHTRPPWSTRQQTEGDNQCANKLWALIGHMRFFLKLDEVH